MFKNEEGTVLYTQEDIDVQFKAGVDYATNAISNGLRNQALAWFKQQAKDNYFSRDMALEIFNGLAEELGWDTVTSINSLFTVQVSYNGNIIGEFADIEAESAEAAEEEVRYGCDVPSVEMEISVSYDNYTINQNVDYTYDFDGEFEFEATEQD